MTPLKKTYLTAKTAKNAKKIHRYASRKFVTYPLSPARHRSYYFWAAASFLPRQIFLLPNLAI